MNDPVLFNEIVYYNLPEVLKDATSVFQSQIERDLYLLSQIAVLSGFFPNVYCIYDNDKTSMNIFAMIVGPHSSGKGKMKYALKAVSKLDEAYFKNKAIDSKYNKSLIIPGNTSSSAFIDKLSANKGVGIMFEPEADTLTQSFKQKWGNFSSDLRYAFQNEDIRKLRKGEATEQVIKNPKLSISISCTPNQLPLFVPSIENGLFFRIVYYYFSKRVQYRDPRTKINSINFNEHFDRIGSKLLEIYNFVGEDEFQISLSEKQWDGLVKMSKGWESYFENQKLTSGFSSSVIRYSLIAYRITMLMSLLRTAERGLPFTNPHICSDEDFAVAENIMWTLFQHGAEVYSLVTNKSNQAFHAFDSEKLMYLSYILPVDKTLTTNQIFDNWKAFNLQERMMHKYLKRLIDAGYIMKIKNGSYFVPEQEGNAA